MKELMKGINEIITDNMFYDIDTEIMGVTNEGVQEIIALCADEAIAILDDSYARLGDTYTSQDMYVDAHDALITELKK